MFKIDDYVNQPVAAILIVALISLTVVLVIAIMARAERKKKILDVDLDERRRTIAITKPYPQLPQAGQVVDHDD